MNSISYLSQLFSKPIVFTIVVLLTTPSIVIAENTDALAECLLQRIKVDSNEVTIGQLKNTCQNEHKSVDASGVVEERFRTDDRNILRPFTLMAHKPNYILVTAHNSSNINADDFRTTFNDQSIEIDDTEAQFQLSIKFPLAINLFDEHIDIYTAYSNRSFWQVYNSEQSAPFRETNHEP